MSRIEKEYLEHVYYEMKYYFWTYDNLNTKICNELHNVILESHIVHLRNLAVFFRAKEEIEKIVNGCLVKVKDESSVFCTKFGIHPMKIKGYSRGSKYINKNIFHLDMIRLTEKDIKDKQDKFVKEMYYKISSNIRLFLENLEGSYLNYEQNLRIWLIDKATKATTHVDENPFVFEEIALATYSEGKVSNNSTYQANPEVSINSGDVQSDNLGPGSNMSDYYVWKSHSDETDNK